MTMNLIEPSRFHRKGPKGIIDKLAIGKERAKYGISQADIICLSDYLGTVLVNGLRLLAEYEHGWPGTEEFPTPEIWENKLLEIADKLEQACTTDKQIEIVYGEIDWSNDEPAGLEEDEDWLEKSTSTPAFKEYSRRTDEIQNLAEKNLKEAMEWITKNWWSLWD